MSNFKQIITDAEYSIMEILWSSDQKLTVADVAARLEGNDWSASTVSTFLQRLLKKGVISCDKKGKANLYYPLLSRSEYDLSETESFLSKLYNGSVKNFVAAMYQSNKLSHQDIDDIKKMFDLE